MKKVKFDNSWSVAMQLTLTGEASSDILNLEGWLVDDHICVQAPIPEIDAGWRVSLYPWGHLIGFDFYTKADAVEYAKDVRQLGIDWASIYSAENFGETLEFKTMLARLIEVRDRYQTDGFFRPEI